MQTLHLRFRDLRAISRAPPRPMANPFDAAGIDMGDGVASLQTLSDQPWRLDRPARAVIPRAGVSTDAP